MGRPVCLAAHHAVVLWSCRIVSNRMFPHNSCSCTRLFRRPKDNEAESCLTGNTDSKGPAGMPGFFVGSTSLREIPSRFMFVYQVPDDDDANVESQVLAPSGFFG